MDKYKKLGDVLRKAGGGTVNMDIVAAEVKAVDGEKCTVKWGDTELTDVRLKATINGKTQKVLITPKVGSYVLLGSLTGDQKDMCVVSFDEVEKIEYQQDGLNIMIDSTDKKVRIKNSSFSLLSLIHEFIDICRDEIHMTNSGPTVALNPANKVLLNLLKQKFSNLLKN